MWSLHTDAGNSIHGGQYAKNVYLGETRIVTKLCLRNDPRADAEELQQYFYHSDHLGSASLISDYKGDEYQRIEYTPYGETWIERTDNKGLAYLPYKFTAKELDSETGLYYFGARYLDSKYSTWISTDPALGDYIPQAPVNDEARKHNQNLPGMGGIFNHINCNLYAYGANNPVRYIDPDGNFSICDYYIPDLLLLTKPSTKVLGIPLGGGLSSTQKEIKKIHDLIFLGAGQIPNVGSFASSLTTKSFLDGVKLISGIISQTAGTVLSMVDLLTIISTDPDIQAHNYTSNEQELLAMCAIEQSFTKDFSQALKKEGFYNEQRMTGTFIENLEIIVSNYFTDKEILLKIANEVKNSNPLYERVQIQLGE